MQFYKVISYKLRVFKVFITYNRFFSKNTLAVPCGFHTLIKRLKTGVCLMHITYVSKGNGKQKLSAHESRMIATYSSKT